MTTEKIRKDIEINASAEKVWAVLVEGQFNQQWYESFSEGTQAHTDWQVGSKVIFKDESGSGIIGKIVESEPGKLLLIRYNGVLNNNEEDYDSEKAQEMQGFEENYIIETTGTGTHLHVTSDMGSEYFDMMSAAWNTAMQKIKMLAESL